MGWMRKHWLGLLGWITLGSQAIKFIVGLFGDIDFILSRAEDPGWVAVMLSAALDPPQWVNFILIAAGLGLIYWDSRRKRPSGPDADLSPQVRLPVAPTGQSWKTKIPDIRAAESSSVRQLFDGHERKKLIGLLQSGDVVAWSYTNHEAYKDLRPLLPSFWLQHTLTFTEIDGKSQTILQGFDSRPKRSWAKVETPTQLTARYDVHFNRAQLQAIWPDIRF